MVRLNSLGPYVTCQAELVFIVRLEQAHAQPKYLTQNFHTCLIGILTFLLLFRAQHGQKFGIFSIGQNGCANSILQHLPLVVEQRQCQTLSVRHLMLVLGAKTLQLQRFVHQLIDLFSAQSGTFLFYHVHVFDASGHFGADGSGEFFSRLGPILF
ncbi:hypothetical protein BpHYR1_045601 [Brachionus plicatilis]|uniref:Uncharacterized protein n=1 Tax=Brachionus plicatilis TaxID=10195 RepID=A0A3M7S6M9_BRAPC|nr:hypothetical protein BpHYR1_045601 [Brachionus plicatilis]